MSGGQDAERNKRKLDAVDAPGGSGRGRDGGSSGGGGYAAGMTLEAAKALLEQRGIKVPKAKKAKKEKKEKKEKKKKDRKEKKKHKSKRDGDSSSSSSSDDDDAKNGGGGGGPSASRKWKSGGGVKDKDKVKNIKDYASSWGPPPGPDVQIENIYEDDYYLKNHEFAAWLKHTRKVYFTDLLAQDAREAFKGFITEWNARRLPAKLYEGISVAGRR